MGSSNVVPDGGNLSGIPVHHGTHPPWHHVSGINLAHDDQWSHHDRHHEHNVVSGSPAPWRLSTIGGWSWQPRLAVSDQLPPALDLNPEFQLQFEAGGVPGIDPDALKSLIMH